MEMQTEIPATARWAGNAQSAGLVLSQQKDPLSRGSECILKSGMFLKKLHGGFQNGTT